jgi:hypothetical protein
MSVFTRLLSSSHGASITGSIEHLGGFNITGSIQANQADGSSSFQLTRNDTSIQTHDPIGDIIWSGMGPATGAPHTGAMITAVAAQDWTSSYQQGTDLKFRVQSNASGVDQLAAGAFLVLSGANGRAEFTGDVFTGNRLYSPNGAQIGPSTDGDLADQTGYPLRVSSDTGGVGIELDANGAGNTTSILFNYGGGAVTNKPGIFVSPNSAADFSIRKNSTAQENGAIMIDANMRSVRVGGGGFGTDAYDPAASLVVSASEANRNSWVMLRSRHDTVVTDNAPILTLDFKSNTGAANTGAWHMGVSPHGTKPLRITGAAVGNSVIQDNTVAMTFNSAGASTSIGVGGAGTWPTSNLPRSQDPTGSFHIEHTNATTDQLTANLTKANLLLGNSAAGGSTVYSQLAFDISSAFTPNKHTANITVSKKQSTGTGHMSFRMYDESGNDNSTRPRVRIDGQGAIIMLSGSTPGAGAGWPKVDNSEYLIGTKMPSGSLTLVANKPGGLWNPPTLNLVTWGSNTHSSPAIVLGDSLGRIQWWSSDSQLTAESERVGAYIEAHATANHTGTTKSPSSMSFFVRAPAAAAPTVKMIISPTMVMFNDDIRVGGDITVIGNNIKDSGAANAITFDGSANTKIEGDLTVAGNNIKDAGAANGITFDGSGNTKIDGELTLGDNVIKSLDGTIAITTVDSVGDVIVGGKLSTDFVKSKTTNITLDAAGDIILSADGDTITMDDGTTTRFTFNVDSTPELDVTGDFKLDGSGFIEIESSGAMTLDAQGNFLIDGEGTVEIDSASSILLDAATDITLDAAGDQIYFKDAGSTRFTFNLDATPEIDVTGAFTLDCSSTCTIDSVTTTIKSDNDLILEGADNSVRFNIGGTTDAVVLTSTKMNFDGVGEVEATGNLTLDASANVLLNAGVSNNYVDVYANGGNGADKYALRVMNSNTGTSADAIKAEVGVNANAGNYVWFLACHTASGRMGTIRGDDAGGIEISNAFTGYHPTVIAKSDNPEPGMITESTGAAWAKNGISTGIPKVTVTTSSVSKKVYGVVSEMYIGEQEILGYEGYVKTWGLESSEYHIKVNSVGEGRVLVTNINGEILNGDYITSSDIPGIGQKQNDDILRSSTVAKCVEDIDWDSITDSIDHNGTAYKKALVCCTYTCG